MSGRGTQRIDPAAFLFEHHTRKAKIMNHRPLFWRQSTDQIFSPITAQGLVQPLAGEAGYGGHQGRARLGNIPDFAAIDIETIVRQVDGQELSVTIHQIGPSARWGSQGARIFPCI